MAQRPAAGTELVLEHRAQGPGLDPGGATDAIDLEHPVQSGEVDGHHAGVGVTDAGLDPTHHRRAAPVGDGGDAGVGAPVEQGHDVGLGAGPGHHVRGIGQAAERGCGPRLGRPCRGCGRPAPTGPSVQVDARAAGASMRDGRRSRVRDRRRGVVRLGREPEAGHGPAEGLALPGVGGLVLPPPSPPRASTITGGGHRPMRAGPRRRGRSPTPAIRRGAVPPAVAADRRRTARSSRRAAAAALVARRRAWTPSDAPSSSSGVRPCPATSMCRVARSARRWKGEEVTRVLWTLATGTRAVSRTSPPRRTTTWSSTVAHPRPRYASSASIAASGTSTRASRPQLGSHAAAATARATAGTRRRAQALRRAAPGARVRAQGGAGRGAAPRPAGRRGRPGP